MAGYDPNNDYSKAIEEARSRGEDTTQLQKERKAKIAEKYGGKEPTMYGSDKTYSQLSTERDSGRTRSGRNSASGAIKSAAGYDPTNGGTPLTKVNGGVTGGWTRGVYGTPILQDNPYYKGVSAAYGVDGSRRTDLAGGMAVHGGYTHFYDDDGRMVRAVKGAVDYLPESHKDYYVGKGSYNGGNLWTDEEMLTTDDLAKIQTIRAQMNAGILTGDQANAMANQIRSGYGYNIDKGGNVTGLDAMAAVAERRRQMGLPGEPVGAGGAGAALGQYSEAWNGGRPSVDAGGYDLGGYENFDEFLSAMGYDSYSDQTQAAIRASVQKAVNDYQQQIKTVEDETDELARQAYVAKMMGQKNLDQQLAANGYAGGMADSQRIATETAYQNQLNELEQQKAATIRELQSAIYDAQLTGDLQMAQELAGYLQQVQGQWNNYVMNQQALANENYWRQQSLNAEGQESAWSRAMSMIEAGYTPNDELLAAAGLDRTSVNMMMQGSTPQAAVPYVPAAAPNPGTPPAAPVDDPGAEPSAYETALVKIRTLKERGESAVDINNIINAMLQKGQITETDALRLRRGFVQTGR